MDQILKSRVPFRGRLLIYYLTGLSNLVNGVRRRVYESLTVTPPLQHSLCYSHTPHSSFHTRTFDNSYAIALLFADVKIICFFGGYRGGRSGSKFELSEDTSRKNKN